MSTVLVIGAGMAGLVAARSLRAAGVDVVVLDKGRAVGGRMATRRIGDATFDHGAQHISARSDAFAAEMERLVAAGTAHVWLRTASVTQPERGTEDRYAGTGGMRRIPEALATGLDVKTGVTVDRLDTGDGRVAAIAGGGVLAFGDGAIVTPPVPQTLDLLHRSGIPPSPLLVEIADHGYDATLAVMARLDAPAQLPDGHLALDQGPVAWVADNRQKRVSASPALTIHSSTEFAATNFEVAPEQWTASVVAAAAPHYQGTVVEAIGHRWRYSQPRLVSDAGAVLLESARPVVVAGEAFGGARVEGAFTSGRRAAALLLERIA